MRLGTIFLNRFPTLSARISNLTALRVQFVVLAAINPLRRDRVPERFPTIVQDALVIGIFLVVATFVLDEKFLTTSAVGAVVVGFAV